VTAIEIENEGLLSQALREGVNLFLGAGFSIMARNEDNKTLPLGAELKQELIEVFKKQDLSSLSLPQLSQVLYSEQREDFYAFLRKRLRAKTFNPLYRNLFNAKIAKVFTVNIDNLLSELYKDFQFGYLHNVAVHGASVDDFAAIPYYPLHGHIDHGARFIFTPTEISASFSNSPDDWYLVKREFQEKDTIFWGFALEDADVLQALEHVGLRTSQGNRWAVLRSPSDATKAYFRSMGFQIISADTENFLRYLGNFKITPSTTSASTSMDEAVRGILVPRPVDIPARPIREFFMGAAPAWSDIASTQIHVLSHMKGVQDAILRGKNVAIVGLPLSGKTTVLMQAAYTTKVQKQKIFIDSLTQERAEYILDRVQRDKTVIFIDNLVDSIDALQLLMKEKVQFVASDREYRFESISHRFPRRDLDVFNVGEIPLQDAQSIYDTIPVDMKRPEFRAPGQDINNYVFEIIESNVKDGRIGDRFRKVLREMEANNKDILDLFVMISYVHECRCYVSFDMLYLFLDRPNKTYGDVIECISKLKELVKEFEGAVDDEHQDYYRARSSAVSFAVIREASQKVFRRVYERFHDVISPMVIPRYDIFRRYAYDDDFAARAFPEWKDGLRFYQKLVRRTDNHYDWQHGALYLARRKQYQEAFKWIDTAMSRSGSRVFTIRNSHARILFEANFPFAATAADKVRPQLDQSMHTLIECYRSDRQKIYHAIRFAEQSIRYFDVYGDGPAKQYLRDADEWLREQSRTASWNRRIPQMQREVRKRID